MSDSQTIPGAPTYGVPPSTIMGNLKPGLGPAQPISITDLASAVAATGMVANPGAPAATVGATGSYTLASITVANGLVTSASNGSASGGGLFSQVLSSTPTSAGTGLTTWVNQSTTTVADTATGVLLTGVATGSSNTTRISARSLASPSTPYTYTALLAIAPSNVIFPWCGIGWYDGTKFHVFSYFWNGSAMALRVDRWSNTTTFSATDGSSTIPPATGFVWLRIEDDGTNVTFSWSIDGANYITMFTVAKSTGYLGSTGYSNVVWYINPQTASTNVLATLMSWAKT